MVPYLRFLCSLALALGVAQTAAAADKPQIRPPSGSLLQALALTPADAATMSVEARLDAAMWLWWWKHMGHTAPVSGSTDDWIAAGRKGTAILRTVIRDAPKDPRAYWMLAEANYDIGELLPEDDTAARTALYEEMIVLAERCVRDVDPNNGACWHFYATGKGRLSTTRGLINSMFEAKSVEKAWQRAWELQPADVLPNGDPMTANIAYGLAVFYRLVPDAWIVKLVIGTRGDIDKSLDYARKAAALQPWRLEIQKELALSLICRGARKKSAANHEEGMTILRKIVAGGFDQHDPRAFNIIDKRHAVELLDAPAKACGYSRDGYEEVDMAEAERRLKSEGKVPPGGS
jgi:hypothetical protein